MIDLRQIQDEVREWGRHNFPDAKPYYCLLGLQEELGELSRAHLKAIEGIRGGDQAADEKDAAGDIVIFLLHFSAMSGYNLESIIKETWDHVKERDWKRNPKSGV